MHVHFSNLLIPSVFPITHTCPKKAYKSLFSIFSKCYDIGCRTHFEISRFQGLANTSGKLQGFYFCNCEKINNYIYGCGLPTLATTTTSFFLLNSSFSSFLILSTSGFFLTLLKKIPRSLYIKQSNCKCS